MKENKKAFKMYKKLKRDCKKLVARHANNNNKRKPRKQRNVQWQIDSSTKLVVPTSGISGLKCYKIITSSSRNIRRKIVESKEKANLIAEMFTVYAQLDNLDNCSNIYSLLKYINYLYYIVMNV